jgi:hypothetical protein
MARPGNLVSAATYFAPRLLALISYKNRTPYKSPRGGLVKPPNRKLATRLSDPVRPSKEAVTDDRLPRGRRDERDVYGLGRK